VEKNEIEAETDPWIGRSIHSKYRVKSVLGEGAFGKVLRVLDETDSLE
jgi:hypothetical protein